MLRFGLFGTGHWATETHGAALDAHPRAELAGVWGRNPERAAALAERYGVPAFDDVDALIEACDAVAVALPPDIQADIAVRAATAGRHLLLDKPLALSLADADRVVEAAQGAGVASVVFFTQRFQPNVTAFLAATAAAGGWQHAKAIMFSSIYQPGSPYGGSQWRKEHGALWDVGPHALSIILPVMGRVETVAAVDGPRGFVHLLLTHDGGATSSISLTLDAPTEAMTRELAFYGENGIETVPPGQTGPATAFTVAIDQLLEEIEAGTRDHRCDVRFGREVVAVLAAAETARAESRTITIPA
ncbi:Gfo/Idh/MocA family protein [Micromonospora sp. URMC 103]|uniref:Gfo/Idh/MocA family protein n=1 Tax=Micromonospora sp. URMC 103 TaxID=3423406 RepID=UPI003F195E3B